MGKSTRPYFNPLLPEHDAAWTQIPGLDGAAEELTLSLDPQTGEYTRLTPFHPGADTSAFGAKSHPYPEEIFVVSGRLYDRAFDLWLTPGHYASRPPGEVHGPFRTDEGCVVLEVSFPNRGGDVGDAGDRAEAEADSQPPQSRSASPDEGCTTAAGPSVSLREITGETVRQITELAVREDQGRFVAENAVSLAEALFAPESWYRAIYRDEEPVGFLMLYDETLRPDPPPAPRVAVWRFMIDARHQGRGIGAEALRQLIAHVQAKGVFASLLVSFVPGPGCPEAFYLRAGFRHTGLVEDGEVVLALALGDPEGRGHRSSSAATGAGD